MKALALDLGGSGGKIFIGSLTNCKITLKEVHRFSNQPIDAAGRLYWDIMGIYTNLLEGIRKAGKFATLGIDSFCNDYGLLDESGALYSQVYMYRDPRTEGMIEKIEAIIPSYTLYKKTGCQRARFNTLVQLAAQVGGPDSFLLNNASTLLFVPELLDYFLSGEKCAEFTIASVSQAYNRIHGIWDEQILQPLGIPVKTFPHVIPPATVIGQAQKSILRNTGSGNFKICTVCHHDTASAVMAVPSAEKHFAYISSGTWSLMGTEMDEMITSSEAYDYNFANEGGFGGKNRFLKNIMGLWLLQECKRQFDSQGQNLDYAELDLLAGQSAPFRSLINPNDPVFFEPGDMVEKIRRQCMTTNQPLPETPGEITRCIKESLALAYRNTLEHIESATGNAISHVHIIGGGAQSTLLNRFAASAMGKPVFAGPFEAAAIGNLCAQFVAAGDLGGLSDVREIIRNSFAIQEFLPENAAEWDDAYGRFIRII